jgi:cysteine desulfurase/selenocysteine lyase
MRAFAENVKILLDYGLHKVEEQILSLKRDLRLQFRELGYEILTPEKGCQSGIITVKPDQDPKHLFHRLQEQNIVISLRNDCLRFSPHFYNTQDEVDAIITVLKR